MGLALVNSHVPRTNQTPRSDNSTVQTQLQTDRIRQTDLHKKSQTLEKEQSLYQKFLNLITAPYKWFQSLFSSKTKTISKQEDKLKIEYFATNKALIRSDQFIEKIFKLRDENMLKTKLTDEIREQGFLGSSEIPNNSKKIYSLEERKQKLVDKFLVHAETNGKVIAYALGSKLSDMVTTNPQIINELKKLGDHNLEHGFFLNEICTDQAYRGQGIAKRLISSLKNIGDLKYVLLTIDPQNKASIAAHEKMGAKRINDSFKIKDSSHANYLYFLAI